MKIFPLCSIHHQISQYKVFIELFTLIQMFCCKQSRRHGGTLVALAPPSKAPSPPNWNVKHNTSVEFWSIFRTSSPSAQTQSPPIENFLATVLAANRYWKMWIFTKTLKAIVVFDYLTNSKYFALFRRFLRTLLTHFSLVGNFTLDLYFFTAKFSYSS